jgi:hypothetical protein
MTDLPAVADPTKAVTKPLSRRLRLQEARKAMLGLVPIVIAALFFFSIWGGFGWMRANFPVPQCAAMAIGALVGAVELLGRYRHAPVRALLTLSGASYMVINVAASWAAYYMIGEFKIFDNLTTAKELTHVLAAGFGSLVFMRSSFFKVRVGESDIGIGPAAILDTILLVADRGVDRREAVARAQDVTALVSHVSDPRLVAKMLTKYSLALMQNVDERTSQDLDDTVGKIMSDTEIPDAIKMDIVALRLGIVVGPNVLEAAVEALGDRLTQNTRQGPVPPALPPGPAPVIPEQPTAVVRSTEELRAEIERKSGE